MTVVATSLWLGLIKAKECKNIDLSNMRYPITGGEKILKAQEIADGPGHHGYLEISKDPEEWVIVYHRRTVGDSNPHHRYLCIDKMEFDGDEIKPIIMT